MNEKTQETLARLETAVAGLVTSDDWKESLRTMARCHNYSFYNTLLIILQRRNASMVAGFNKWRDEFGRHVKKGEKGIAILAPCFRKVEQERPDGTTEARERLIGFRAVYVFDVSQTDGRALPV